MLPGGRQEFSAWVLDSLIDFSYGRALDGGYKPRHVVPSVQLCRWHAEAGRIWVTQQKKRLRLRHFNKQKTN